MRHRAAAGLVCMAWNPGRPAGQPERPVVPAKRRASDGVGRHIRRLNPAARAAGSIPSVDSRSSSTTPGYFASLVGGAKRHGEINYTLEVLPGIVGKLVEMSPYDKELRALYAARGVA